MTRARLTSLADVGVTALLAGSALLQILLTEASRWENGRTVNAALAACATLPLLFRRRQPLPVLGVVAVASWLQYELDGGLGQPFFAMLLAAYSVAAHAERRHAAAGAAVAGGLVLSIDVPRLRDGAPVDEVLPAWFLVAAVWGFGRWMRSRRHHVADLQLRAETLQRNRDEETRHAVATERTRIARELHDLVAHSMGVIVIQSQAAQRVLRADPARAEQSLLSIETLGRQGMAEMRRLLDVVIGPDEVAPRAPQPSLQQVDALVETVRAAGLPVDVCIEGDARPLPAGVDLSAYRIVQEALTNVLRHSVGARATVRLRYADDRLELEVADDGSARQPPATPGRGLIGMRERAALYGGSLEAGPRPGGGFAVRAHLRLDVVQEAAS
jgi:signal transduction histidine kinase